MHATSTPTLAQPKNGAFAALGAAAILTAAIGFGAVIGMNLPTLATPTAGAGSAAQIEAGLAAKQAGTVAASVGAGSALAIEQGLAAKSDEGANAAAVAAESFAIGGRDPQAGFNNTAIDPVAEYHAARAAAGWYPVAPTVVPTDLADYFAARSGWGGTEGNTEPVGTSHR